MACLSTNWYLDGLDDHEVGTHLFQIGKRLTVEDSRANSVAKSTTYKSGVCNVGLLRSILQVSTDDANELLVKEVIAKTLVVEGDSVLFSSAASRTPLVDEPWTFFSSAKLHEAVNKQCRWHPSHPCRPLLLHNGFSSPRVFLTTRALVSKKVACFHHR